MDDFCSLIISAIINLIVAINSNFNIIKWLWLINGLALSVLWPTLVRLLSETLPQKDLGKSSLIMGTTVATGTLIIYSLSSVYAIFDKFKLAFYTAAIAETIVAALWILLYKRTVRGAKKKSNRRKCDKREKKLTQGIIQQKRGEKKVFYTSIYVLCFAQLELI